MAHDTLDDHERRQMRAAVKIELQKSRMASAGASPRHRVDDAQLMNEMRHNKAAVDLNRALFDHQANADKV